MIGYGKKHQLIEMAVGEAMRLYYKVGKEEDITN
jgi:hypothetical protein